MADDGERQAPAPGGRVQRLGDKVEVDDGTMEDLMERLKMLNYESEFVKSNGNSFKLLTKSYFAEPSDNANLQFFYFTSLCAWLMQVAGHRGFEAPGQFDDPNATSTNLLNELRAMNLSVSFPPNRIRQGHGDAILTILGNLADRALQARGFTFRLIEYPAPRTDLEERVGEADTGPVADDPDAIDDNIAIDSDDDDDDQFRGVGSNKGQHRPAAADVIEPQVSAEQWALEVERVAPLLQYRTDDIRDWRARVEQASTLLKAVEKMYPDVKQMLERMGDDLSKSTDRIQKREQSLGQQFAEQVEEYRNKLRELNVVQDAFNSASKNVSSLSKELNSVTEALKQTTDDIKDREERASDISPLNNIRDAVSKIKTEIKQMSLRIGVLQHTVLHYTLRQQKNRRVSPTATATNGLDESGAVLDPDFQGYM